MAKIAVIPPIPRTTGMTAELSARLEDDDVDEEAPLSWASGTAGAVVELLVGNSVFMASAVGRFDGASLGSFAVGLFWVGEVMFPSVVGMLSVGALKEFSVVGLRVASALVLFSSVGNSVAVVVVFSAVGICVAGRTLVVFVGILVGARVGF